MYTLFNVKFNWPLFIGFALFLQLFFPGLSIYSYIAILITLQQFMLLFNSIGTILPVRYLFGAFMCLQMFLGPMFAYNGLDDFQRGRYKMQIPEEQYFLYVIPAVVAFIIGLHITAKKFEGELIDVDSITDFSDMNPYLAYNLIGVGFVCSVINQMVSTEFAFVFNLLGSLKFIGVFLIILGKKQLNPLPLTLVFTSIIVTSLGEGMFHDLLIWMIFILAVFAIKYKPSTKVKAIAALSFVLLAVTIQQLKGDYREATWHSGEDAGLETFQAVLESNQEKGVLFSNTSLATSNIRINQGFIVTNIMQNVPARVPFANGGEMGEILEAAFLPRFLAPNKLMAGSRDLFTKYSGMPLKKGTSMALSSIGDAYINFGTVGGSAFMFVLGLIYSLVLKQLFKRSRKFPLLLLFPPLIFYYPIRPDCELQTTLGHLVKATFLIFFLMYFFKDLFEAQEKRKQAGVSSRPELAESL